MPETQPSGSGTEQDPYQITTIEELQWANNDLDGVYELQNDIDASDTVNWNGGEGFRPIGSPSEFTGTLYGKNYEVSSLYINRIGSGLQGLFKSIANVTLQNFSLDSAEIEGLVVSPIGSITSDLGESTIDDVHVKNANLRGNLVRGFIRYIKNSTIKNCSTESSITVDEYDSSTSVYDGDGFAGSVDDTLTTIEKCYSVADIDIYNSSEGGIGGFIGSFNSSADSVISECYADGYIELHNSTGNAIGGFVGAANGNSTIENCYTTVDIINANDTVGGFIGFSFGRGSGEQLLIERCYAGNNIDASATNIGGLGGDLDSYDGEIVFNYSYWDTESSGYTTAIGNTDGGDVNTFDLIGLTTSEMTGDSAETNMDNLDFVNTWDTRDNNYPGLRALIPLAVAPTGSGTEQDPYLIEVIGHFQWVQNDRDAVYRVVNDIDASETSSWNAGEGFTPVGVDSDPFTGVFYGQDYIFEELYIDRPNVDYQSPFGVCDDAEIYNTNFHNVDITGDNSGGLVSDYRSSTYDQSGDSEEKPRIEECSVTGSVVSSGFDGGGLVGNAYNTIIDDCWVNVDVEKQDDTLAGGFAGALWDESKVFNSTCNVTFTASAYNNVGGFVGHMASDAFVNRCSVRGIIYNGGNNTGGFVGVNNGQVINSYSQVTVDGSDNVGGFAGQNTDVAEITRSYSSGQVAGTGDVGGFVGQNNTGGQIYFTYYDVSNSGQSNSAGTDGGTDNTTSLTTSEMQGSSAETNMDDLNFTTIYTTTDSYPILQHEYHQEKPDGDGTQSNPYVITNIEEFQWIKNEPDAIYTVANTIDASDTQSWNNGEGFEPINLNSGQLSGQDYRVKSIYINRPNIDTAVFSSIDSSVLENIGFTDVNISSNSNVASVATSVTNNSTIEHVYSTGKVNATVDSDEYISIFISELTNSDVVECYSYCDISVEEISIWTGASGFIADCNSSTITDSYANFDTEVISGDPTDLSGFIGHVTTDSAISTSYSAPTFTSTSNQNGFALDNSGSYTDCYWDTDINSATDKTITGITPLTTSEMQGASAETNMSGFDFTNTWDSVDGYYPVLQSVSDIFGPATITFTTTFSIDKNPGDNAVFNSLESEVMDAFANGTSRDIVQGRFYDDGSIVFDSTESLTYNYQGVKRLEFEFYAFEGDIPSGATVDAMDLVMSNSSVAWTVDPLTEFEGDVGRVLIIVDFVSL